MGADLNAATIRRRYQAFNSGDMNTLTEIFDENAVWHATGRSPLADDYQGRDATFADLPGRGRRPEGPSRPGCSIGSQTTSGWSAFSTTARSEMASTWALATASASSSRMAG